ncbi:hypothetical protein B0I37DRAFT_375916 [Chaetomium sp. MPI-CAGE-AT-0009]|nr:hypothetical protein B0I37DRAFT_375916 [Chaetomium sp. MPI-CAGE-AT-0009]
MCKPLGDIQDDRTNSNMGYSFLQDPANTEWVAEAERYLTVRAMREQSYNTQWIRQGAINRAHVKVYQGDFLMFLKALVAAVHLTGGLPLQRKETLTLRHTNSAGGGLRNVLVWNGYVMTRSIGGKMFWKKGEKKVWRLLPARLSRAVVVYTSVVVPFLQALEMECDGGKGLTEFLFSSRVAAPEPRLLTGREMMEAAKGAFGREHDTSITVAAWRHIAIAFGRKYLTGDFAAEQLSMLEGDEEEGDGDDAAIDEMAGHTTKVAELHYARELDDGSKFDEFYNLGVRWH